MFCANFDNTILDYLGKEHPFRKDYYMVFLKRTQGYGAEITIANDIPMFTICGEGSNSAL